MRDKSLTYVYKVSLIDQNISYLYKGKKTIQKRNVV